MSLMPSFKLCFNSQLQCIQICKYLYVIKPINLTPHTSSWAVEINSTSSHKSPWTSNHKRPQYSSDAFPTNTYCILRTKNLSHYFTSTICPPTTLEKNLQSFTSLKRHPASAFVISNLNKQPLWASRVEFTPCAILSIKLTGVI